MEHHPNTATALFGHKEAEGRLFDDAERGRLPHGLIISGPKGIGKATLAYRFARALLSGEPTFDMSSTHPVFRRVAAGSHSDLLVIEPLFDEKKEEYAREISVEQAREVAKFLSLTPAEGDWRVVIIDSADAMNVNAANAILKILEEPPPQAILMLIAHQPGLLLPTIRSRCHTLGLKPLPVTEFVKAVTHILPDMDSKRLAAYAQLAGGAPGRAIQYEGQGAIELYDDILGLLADLPAIEPQALHAFADSTLAGTPHERWRLLSQLMLFLFERVTKQAAKAEVDTISIKEDNTLKNLARLHPAGVWAARWQHCADQFLLTERLHLDYKQVIIAFFHSIASQEGFQLGNTAA